MYYKETPDNIRLEHVYIIHLAAENKLFVPGSFL